MKLASNTSNLLSLLALASSAVVAVGPCAAQEALASQARVYVYRYNAFVGKGLRLASAPRSTLTKRMLHVYRAAVV